MPLGTVPASMLHSRGALGQGFELLQSSAVPRPANARAFAKSLHSAGVRWKVNIVAVPRQARFPAGMSGVLTRANCHPHNYIAHPAHSGPKGADRSLTGSPPRRDLLQMRSRSRTTSCRLRAGCRLPEHKIQISALNLQYLSAELRAR